MESKGNLRGKRVSITGGERKFAKIRQPGAGWGSKKGVPETWVTDHTVRGGNLVGRVFRGKTGKNEVQ